MKWRVESWTAYFERRETWHPRFALIPHSCSLMSCGEMRWLEPMLSRHYSSYASDVWLWACSEAHAVTK